jgi:hypothetical protein
MAAHFAQVRPVHIEIDHAQTAGPAYVRLAWVRRRTE